jgi:hypothetical protein
MKQTTKLAVAAVIALTAATTACKKNFEKQAAGDLNAGVLDVRPDSTLTGVITTDLTLSNTKEYFLDGIVYIAGGADLTIEPGSLIRGNLAAGAGVSPGTLVITKGSKIIADGVSPSTPIVFTSAATAGNRRPGDWGGVVILGNGRVNQAQPLRIEGIPDNSPADATYGGSNNDDTSGIIRYVRVEFAGYSLTPNNETNGITFGGVGRGTVVDFVQVSWANDDAFEFFGGAVNAKHLFAFNHRDDGFDFDFGYSGKIQYGFACASPDIADNSGTNGIECDNQGSGNKSGAGLPTTRPVLSNITLVGRPTRDDALFVYNYPHASSVFTGYTYPLQAGAAATGSLNFAVHFRRATRALMCNSISLGFRYGLVLDGSNKFGTADADGQIPFSHKDATLRPDRARFRHNVFQAYDSVVRVVGWPATDYSSVTAQNRFVSDKGRIYTGFNTTPNDSIGIRDPFNSTVARWYQLRNTSRQIDGATFSGLDLKDPFFDQNILFKGAFDFKSSGDWAATWTNFDPINTPY